MESYSFKNVDFTYPEGEKKALCNISFTVQQGEFVILCGPSGCGKSTLLRHLKSCLTPHGLFFGEIRYQGKLLAEMSPREQAQQIGYVLRSPENQVVTDMDLIHAAATVIFIFLAAEPMLEKLDRIKVKYGLVE